ncbi:hypothetical protein BJ742DRAFT_737631 [Cladochytrium replicatum]|nr:hypothetical protein BJ742DRAFT_737631 [Cladochytrium replicatum]
MSLQQHFNNCTESSSNGDKRSRNSVAITLAGVKHGCGGVKRGRIGGRRNRGGRVRNSNGEVDTVTTVRGEADMVLTVGAVTAPKNLMITTMNLMQKAKVKGPVIGKLRSRKRKVDEAGEDNIDDRFDEGIEEEPEEPDDELEDRDDYAEGEDGADV